MKPYFYVTAITVVAAWCIACPFVLMLVGETYECAGEGLDEYDLDSWVWVVDVLFCSDAIATAALIYFARSQIWKIMATILFIPLLVMTGISAVCAGLMIMGTSL